MPEDWMQKRLWPIKETTRGPLPLNKYVLVAERVGPRGVPTWFALCLSTATSGALGRALLGHGACPQLVTIGLGTPRSQAVTNLKVQIS